ncbi:MAG: ferrochelatase [Longimicrobiales bacterium]
MRAAVLFLNFGEPERATLEEVVPFLERIFLINAALEDDRTQAQTRAHELALRRAPGLIAEYQAIGGSPLNEQAAQQAQATQQELQRRGHDVRAYVGMQFTEPSIANAVEKARDNGAQLLIALPVYPVCGPSTTMAALQQLRDALATRGWAVPLREITGWHSHTSYIELRADAIRSTLIAHDLDLSDPDTRLVFSAHGTPTRYLEAGSRYVHYTEHVCHAVAQSLGADHFELGYQNHTNRPIEWTQPDIERVMATVTAQSVVLDPCSFMHEQSETLAELDHDLRESAESRGLRYFRVPVPHDDTHFVTLLADLIEPFITGKVAEAGFRPCRCRVSPETWCLNTVV